MVAGMMDEQLEEDLAIALATDMEVDDPRHQIRRRTTGISTIIRFLSVYVATTGKELTAREVDVMIDMVKEVGVDRMDDLVTTLMGSMASPANITNPPQLTAVASCKSLIIGKTVYVGVPDENLSTNPKSVAGVTQPGGFFVGRAEQREEGLCPYQVTFLIICWPVTHVTQKGRVTLPTSPTLSSLL